MLQVLPRRLAHRAATPAQRLPQRIHTGEQQAMDAVIPLVYGELKKLDGGRLRREGGAKPLETTALVHEAFPRLVGRAQPYLGGMTAEESASANSISVHLVRRELRLAQAWLTKELAT